MRDYFCLSNFFSIFQTQTYIIFKVFFFSSAVKEGTLTDYSHSANSELVCLVLRGRQDTPVVLLLLLSHKSGFLSQPNLLLVHQNQGLQTEGQVCFLHVISGIAKRSWNYARTCSQMRQDVLTIDIFFNCCFLWQIFTNVSSTLILFSLLACFLKT